MTTDLSGAIRGGGDFKKTDLKIGYGAHRGYFIGLGEKVKEVSNFPCKGCRGTGNRQDGPCFSCEGTGRKTTTKVPILYQMSPTFTQEEWVTFAVTEPGKLQDGTPKSGSTLWARLRALSGVSDPAGINAWYGALPKPIKIPIEIMVVDRDDGAGVAIASVRKFDKGQTTAEPPPAPEPEAGYDFPEEF